MSKVTVAAFSISIDGFGAGPRQDLQNPLGVRGTELHNWFFIPKFSRRCTVKTAGARASTTKWPRNLLRMWVRGSWGGICSGRFGDRGKTIRGKGGGATVLRTIRLF